MATRRRDAFPGKEKATPTPQTGTGRAKLRGAINQVSKPKVSTAPQKQTRSALKTTATAAGVSKVQTRKPASSTTAKKPAQTRTRSLDAKTVTPAPRTRVSATTAAARSSLLPVKAVAVPKPAPVKKWKPVEDEEGKRRLFTASSVSGRRSNIGLKKESGNSASSATKEQKQITDFNRKSNVDPSLCCVPQPEMQLQDIEYSYLAEAEEKTVQSLNDFDKRVNDAAREQEQELLDSAKIEDMINHADPMVVMAEPSTVSEQLESPADIKKELENKYSFNKSSDKQELEHDMNERNDCAKVEKIADNSHEKTGEKEVKVVDEVAAEEQAPVASKADETKEIERPAVEKNQESSVPQKQQEKMHGKYDSPVSNNVIKETANKLRELRKNKVRALAGAFETVISLQEK